MALAPGIATRRQFLSTSSIAVAGWVLEEFAGAGGLIALTPGLQLGSVNDHLHQDFEGTLQKVAAIGYREVESSFSGVPVAQVNSALKATGLSSPSGVRAAVDLYNNLQARIDHAAEIGQKYIVCAVPQPRKLTASPPENRQERLLYFQKIARSLTLDDYKWNAERFNSVGEACQRAGLQFCFHGENFDFHKSGTIVPYDELLGRCDKSLVRLEMDCYWIARAGQDPVAYLNRYANRISMLHIRDLARGVAPTVDLENAQEAEVALGEGIIDWIEIVKLARRAGVKHYFVEHERSNRDEFATAMASFHFLQRFQ
jgi:sugar phosphate isomerase/epimerase